MLSTSGIFNGLFLVACPSFTFGLPCAFTFVASQHFPQFIPSSAHLHIREVHLRVLLLELLEYIQLLLLVARGLAGLLLALVEHHLLHHSSCFAVEVAELAVLGGDLAGVDLGRRGDDVRPPLHLVRLV